MKGESPNQAFQMISAKGRTRLQPSRGSASRSFPSRNYCVESMNRSTASRNVGFQPDVFKTSMSIVVDDFNSPSYRIRSDQKSMGLFAFDDWNTKLFRFPRFNLCILIFSE